MSSALVTCSRCAGCGRLANTDAGEPWSAWESLGAARVGLVQPVLCPVCQGSGRVPMPDSRIRKRIEATIDDMMSSLLYYDRKADASLPVNGIEQAIIGGVITVEEIVERVRGTLQRAVDARRAEQQAPPPDQGEP